jgi:hypothetical protein
MLPVLSCAPMDTSRIYAPWTTLAAPKGKWPSIYVQLVYVTGNKRCDRLDVRRLVRRNFDHNSSRPRDLTQRLEKDAFGLCYFLWPKRSETETMMLQSDDVGGPPQLNFEAWRDLLRSNCGGEVEVTAPKLFGGWMRPVNACGLEAASVKIQWGSADLGSFAQWVERSHRDIRLDGADHYLVVFQVAGQSAITQIDQTVQLDVGDGSHAGRRSCSHVSVA